MERSSRLITDEKSVAYMYDKKTSAKINNENIQRWHMVLPCFKCDISHRPGTENPTAATLSCECSVAVQLSLKNIHESLCHPGVTRV